MRAETWLGEFVVALSRQTPAFRTQRKVPPTFLGQFIAALSRDTPAFVKIHQRMLPSDGQVRRRRAEKDDVAVVRVAGDITFTDPSAVLGGSVGGPAHISGDVRVELVHPRSFNDAQQIANRFKDSIPVMVNLQGVDTDLSKRLIDFSSGLTYALDGGMQRIANGVFLLTPRNVGISAEERARLVESVSSTSAD
jgi:FtsZ-interacting cell division protein YlmF